MGALGSAGRSTQWNPELMMREPHLIGQIADSGNWVGTYGIVTF